MSDSSIAPTPNGDVQHDDLETKLRATFAAVRSETPARHSEAEAPVIPLSRAHSSRAKVVAVAAAAAVLIPSGILVASKLSEPGRAVRVKPAADTSPDPAPIGSQVFAPANLDEAGVLLPQIAGNLETAALRVPGFDTDLSVGAVSISETAFPQDPSEGTRTGSAVPLGTFIDPARADFWASVILADATADIDGMLGMVAAGTVPELAEVQPTTKYRDPFGRGAEGFRFSANGVEVAVVGSGILPDDLEKIGENIANAPRATNAGESSAVLIVTKADTFPEDQGGMPDGQVLRSSPVGWVRSKGSRVPGSQLISLNYTATHSASEGSPNFEMTVVQTLLWGTTDPSLSAVSGEAGVVKTTVRGDREAAAQLSDSDSGRTDPDDAESVFLGLWPERLGVAVRVFTSPNRPDGQQGSWLATEADFKIFAEQFVGVNRTGFDAMASQVTSPTTLRGSEAVSNGISCARPSQLFGWAESEADFMRRCPNGVPNTTTSLVSPEPAPAQSNP